MAATLAVCSKGLGQIPARADDAGPEDVVEGNYVNPGYGYSISIPKGLRATRMKPPAPQHGIALVLSDRKRQMIWVNGEHDALLLGSVEALATSTANDLAAKYALRVTETARLKLDGLEATEVVMENRHSGGKTSYAHFVVALRPVPTGVAVVYTIGLEEVTRDQAAESTFLAMVKSFRLIDLP